VIGGLLQSGRLRDSAELRFLEERLHATGPAQSLTQTPQEPPLPLGPDAMGAPPPAAISAAPRRD
jgi:hypothetical protein